MNKSSSSLLDAKAASRRSRRTLSVRFKYIAGESLQEKLLVLLALTSQLPVAGTVAQCLVYRATVVALCQCPLNFVPFIEWHTDERGHGVMHTAMP